MTNVLLAALVVITALNTALDGAAKVLHYFWPKSKVTKEVDVIKSDVAEAEGVVSKLVPPGKQSGRSEMAVMMSMALVALVAACSLTMSCGATQKAALKNLATCSEEAAVKDLTPTVESIIANGVSTWKQQLDALGVAFGESELACAVTAAQQFFASKLGAGSDAEGPEQRASLWLSEHGYK